LNPTPKTTIKYHQTDILSQNVEEMLTYFCEMGIVIWINEEKLRDVVILDPIEYFVKPATMIICKHIATKDDPYHTVHCDMIHKSCRKEWPEDWFQMLEFGLVSDRLARELLISACEDEDHLNIILSLMERYGLSSSFNIISNLRTSVSRISFFPAVAPSDPASYFLDEEIFENNFTVYMDYKNLVGCLHSKRRACLEMFDDYVVFHFAFSVSFESLKSTLLSAHDVASAGFLPNGLFERFVGRVCGSTTSSVLDVPAFLERNNFIGFKDIVKIKFMFRSVKITNILESNMIRVEVERDPCDEKDKEMLMFIHDSLYEMVQIIIRECYKDLIVVTILPTSLEDYHDHPLLPLSELKSLADGKLVSIDYHTVDGRQELSKKVDELRKSFSVWLGVPTIHPKKGEYTNKVFLMFL
jgi:hypothetical protein